MTPAERLRLRRQVVAASQARRRRPRIAPAPPPNGLVLAYTRELLALSREMDSAIWAALRREGVARADAADGSAPDLVDVSTAERRRLVDVIAHRLGEIAGRKNLVGKLEALALRVGQFSRTQWRKQLQDAIGIGPSADLDLEVFVAGWRRKNTALIVSLAKDKVSRVRGVLAEAGVGMRHEQIARRIEEETGATESRAVLIARDQVLKLNADVTEAQHAAAGITEFVWSTSRDERVRKSHRDLDGKRFAYANPPLVDGEAATPGQPVQCRCVAIPVLPGID